jgi:hypothetical protein
MMDDLLCSLADWTILHSSVSARKGGEFYLGTFGDFTPAIDNPLERTGDAARFDSQVV